MLPIRGALKDMGVDYSCLDDDSDSSDVGESWILSKVLTQGVGLVGFVPRRIELICTGMDGVARTKSADGDEASRAASNKTAVTSHDLLARMSVITTDRATRDAVSRTAVVSDNQQPIPEPKQHREPGQQIDRAKPNLSALGPFDPNGLRQDLLTTEQLPTPVTAGRMAEDDNERVGECQSMNTSVSYIVCSESGDCATTDALRQKKGRIAKAGSVERGSQDWLDGDSDVDGVPDAVSKTMRVENDSQMQVVKAESVERDADLRLDDGESDLDGAIQAMSLVPPTEKQMQPQIAQADIVQRDSNVRLSGEPVIGEVVETAVSNDSALPSRSHSGLGSHSQTVTNGWSTHPPSEAVAAYNDDDSDAGSTSSDEPLAAYKDAGTDNDSTSSEEPLARWAESVASDAGSHQVSEASISRGASVSAKTPAVLAESSTSVGEVVVAEEPSSTSTSISVEAPLLAQASVPVDESMSPDKLIVAEGPIPVSDPISAKTPTSDGKDILAEGTIPMSVAMSYEEEILAEGSLASVVRMSDDEDILAKELVSPKTPASDDEDMDEETIPMDTSMSYDEELLVEGSILAEAPQMSDDDVVMAQRPNSATVPISVQKSMSYDEEILVEGSILAEAPDPARKPLPTTKSMVSFEEVVMGEGTVPAREPAPVHAPEIPKAPEPTDDASSGKQKKRIAPMLLSSVLPTQSEGNLVEKERSGLSLVLPVEQLPPSEARKVIQQTLGNGSGWRRRFPHHPRVRLGDTPPHVGGISNEVEDSDSWWFRRSRSADQSRHQQAMRAMHVWHWRYMVSVEREIYGDFDAGSEADQDAGGEAEDPVLAPYGEAESDGELPEDLLREIDAEQQAIAQMVARKAAREAEREALVRETIEAMKEKFRAEWEAQILPGVAVKAYSEWRKHVRRRDDLERLIEADRLLRLPKLEQGIFDSGVSARAEIERSCENLRVTVNELALSEWQLRLVDGPCPPPPPHKMRAKSSGTRRLRRVADSSSSSGSDGDSDSDNDSDSSSSSGDSMDDFIDDTDVVKPPPPPSLSLPPPPPPTSPPPSPEPPVEVEGTYMQLRPRRSQAVAEPPKNRRQPVRRNRGGKAALTKRLPAAAAASFATQRQPLERPAGTGAAIYAFGQLRAEDIDGFKHYVQRRFSSEQCRASRVAALVWMRRRASALGVDVDLSDMGVSEIELAQAVEAAEQAEKTHVQSQKLQISNGAFVSQFRGHTADAAFDAILWFVSRLASGRESHGDLIKWDLHDGPDEAKDKDGTCKATARALGFRVAMRLQAEFRHWVSVFGDGSSATSVSGGGLVEALYPNATQRDAALERSHKLLTRPGLRAEYMRPDDRRGQRLQQFAQQANVFLCCPEPLWGAVNGDAVAFNGGEARTAAMSKGSRALTVRRRWLPMLMQMVDDDAVLARGAFAVFYAWRMTCLVEGDQDDLIAQPDVIDVDMDGDINMLGGDDDDDVVEEVMSSGVVQRLDSARASPAPAPAPAPASAPAKGRRNIRAVLPEDKETLAIQQKLREKDLEISRKRKLMEAAAEAEARVSTKRQLTESGASTSGIVGRRQPAEPHIAGDSDDDFPLLRRTLLAHPEPVAPAPAPPVNIEIDIDAIGRPVLVNPGHADDQRDVFIPGFIAGHLKEHQIEGVRFMWKNVMMTGGGLDKDHGCILAHAMGLGKTLQTIAFVYTLLHEITITGNPEIVQSPFATRRVLILCPPTVQSNWAAEFEKWTSVEHSTISNPGESRLLQLPVFDSSSPPDPNYARCLKRALQRRARRTLTQVVNFDTIKGSERRKAALMAWHNYGGVMIMGYRLFVILMQRALSVPAPDADADATAKDDVTADVLFNRCLRHTLVDGGPCLVVADEGHVIKNPETQLSAVISKLSTRARICLTGYPLQNRLEEYWTMIKFCSPDSLSTLASFRNRYVNPINNGLYADSTADDRRFSAIAMRTLQDLVKPVVDRRDAALLFSQLPRKVEYFVYCPLTDVQRALYSAYLEHVVGIGTLNPGTNSGVLAHGHMLLAICNHPMVFQQTIENNQKLLGQNGNPSSAATSIEDEGSVEPSEDIGIARFIAARDEWLREIYTTHHIMQPPADASLTPPLVRITPEMMLPVHSIKTQIALHIIRESIAAGERVLVFSRSIPTLDHLQNAIETAGLATLGQQMLRIDGSTVVGQRQVMVDRFNADVSELRVFLISSGTGSIGINLVSASRIIIFDVGWNPLYDEQAVARVYRYGQRRRVYVYRLMTRGTWEERLIGNNIFKVGLTRRVIDKQSMGRWVSKENTERYLQHPPMHTDAITEGEAAKIVADHNDDAVLGSLVAEHRPKIADIIPQATLLANEDETLDEAALAEVEVSVLLEKQRLGLAPLYTQPMGDQPEIDSASVPIASPVAVTSAVVPVVTPVVPPASTSAIAPAVVTPTVPLVPTASVAPAAVPDATDDSTFMGSKIGEMSALRALAMTQIALARLAEFPVTHDEVGSRAYLLNLEKMIPCVDYSV
ncbi:hypothetical protein GGI15_001623 [Coemansia interrupta]|uniref:Helicase ATP-binding domain-containing protein n=1 Tax=Coemansia interrupta TaxID=1126814 RepID=A0A9W8HHL1_9FUNG|nr:hypothetical protein GGI15_001623 [Coemansia interrupta]